ncbi:MAG: TIGR00341 family protein [Longimonas sp.]|uniref:TIGR00341 family protein n=1 Tax=Longimonas sp. TaxID=2039626 RepID=UPI003351985C
MAFQQIDVYLPDTQETLGKLGADVPIVDRHTVTLADGRVLERLIVDGTLTEAALERLQKQMGHTKDYRIVVSPIEATLPRPDEDEERKSTNGSDRISREELYQDMSDSVKMRGVYFALVALSVVVAAGGMMRDNTAVVIGAMVIAPLIGPNIALGLGTTLADRSLIVKSLKTNLSGLLAGLSLAFGMGLVLPVDPGQSEIALRTAIGLPDVALAVAAGIAGALAVTRGLSTAIVGVMVAVALVPPLVAVGLLAGSGEHDLAYQAALLLVTNVAGVNLASVLTFLVMGVRPMTWYKTEQAKKATRWALVLWTLVLAVLATAIWLAA